MTEEEIRKFIEEITQKCNPVNIQNNQGNGVMYCGNITQIIQPGGQTTTTRSAENADAEEMGNSVSKTPMAEKSAEEDSSEKRRELAREIKEYIDKLPMQVKPKNGVPVTTPATALNKMFRLMLNADGRLHIGYRDASAEFVKLLTMPYTGTPAERLVPMGIMKVLGFLADNKLIPAAPETYASIFGAENKESNKAAFAAGRKKKFCDDFGDLILFSFGGK